MKRRRRGGDGFAHLPRLRCSRRETTVRRLSLWHLFVPAGGPADHSMTYPPCGTQMTSPAMTVDPSSGLHDRIASTVVPNCMAIDASVSAGWTMYAPPHPTGHGCGGSGAFGTQKTCPANIELGFTTCGLHRRMPSTVVPNLDAMANRLSPGWTT